MASGRWQVIWPFALLGVSFGVLGVLIAVSLFAQQSRLSDVLRENVASQRAAIELEECLLDVAALLKDRVESVGALNARLERHAEVLRRHADQPEERGLAEQVEGALEVYRRRWRELPRPGNPNHDAAVQEAIRTLERGAFEPCREFESFNARQIKAVADDHQGTLRRLAWGMAGFGLLAALTGTLLGYAVTRGLRRTLGRLAVQIHDAAGKIGRMPEIVVTSEVDAGALHDQVDRLTGRIEAVVRELQERQREVLRAEQMSAVGQLAAGVAHEIRNPLTSIKMLVQAGLEEGGLPVEDLRVIEPEVRRMEGSLQTFLDFARPPHPERRPTDLAGVVRQTVGLIHGRAAKQGVRVEVDCPDPGPTLQADGQQLEQVLINLALNALDVMPHGGTLAFRVRGGAAGATLSVTDTGPGLSPEALGKLFLAFSSTKPTGLGLGLVISRRIVEDHGGTLTAANRPVGGAEFTLHLPSPRSTDGIPADRR